MATLLSIRDEWTWLRLSIRVLCECLGAMLEKVVA